LAIGLPRFPIRRFPALLTVLVAVLLCAGQIGHVLHETGSSGTSSSSPARGNNAVDHGGSSADHADGLETSLAALQRWVRPPAPTLFAADPAAAGPRSPFPDVPSPVPISR